MSFIVGELATPIHLQDRDWHVRLDAVKNAGEKTAKHISQRFNQIGDSLIGVGRQLTLLTAPITAAGIASFKMASDFEASMSKITGLVGVAQNQVDEWTDQILRMAPELATKPRELAEAMFFITSAGNRGAQAMELLEKSAQASAAGLGETKTIAHLVSSAVAAYGRENLDAAKATDILVAAVREGKAEAPELAASMGMVLPIASEMGVTFDQVGAATAAMTRTGTDAGTAAMQLRQILSALVRPTAQARDALSEVGLSAEGLRRQLREEGLIAVLGNLRKATADNEEAMSRVFPNIRALAGVLDLMGSNAKENAAIFDSLKDSTGALDHAFESAADTTKFKWNQATAQMEASLITLGNSVKDVAIPMIGDFTQHVEGLTSWFSNLEDNTKKTIVQIGLIASVSGPALVALGMMAKAVAGLASAFVGLRTAMLFLTGPKGLLLLLAGALVTVGIRFRNAIRDINDYKEAVDMLTDSTKELTAAQLQSARAAIEDRLQRATDIVERGNEEIERHGRLWSVLPDTYENAQRAMEKAKDELAEIDERIENVTTSTGENINEMQGYTDALNENIGQQQKLVGVNRLVAESFDGVKSSIAGVNESLNKVSENVNEVAWPAFNMFTTQLTDQFYKAMENATQSMLFFTTVGAKGISDFGNVFVSEMRRVVSATIAFGIAKAIAAELNKGLLGLITGNIAGAGAAALFNTLVPSFAKGGMLHKPMTITAGDNPHAMFDPEVVSPLSKLTGHIRAALGGDSPRAISGGSNIIIDSRNATLTTRVSGDELAFVLERHYRGRESTI